MRLLKWHDGSNYRYQASTKPLFGLLVIWKWDSSRFMKLLVGEYRVFVEHLFVILAAWNPPIEAPCFMWTTARHFGNIKSFKRASDQRYCAFVTLIFRILKPCNCKSSSVLKPSAQGYVTTGGPFLDILMSSKWHSVVPWAQGSTLLVKTFIPFRHPENAIT